MHFIRKRYPHRHLVLMATSSYQLHWFPIQFEAFLRIHAEPANPQRNAHLIFQHLATFIFQRDFHTIQIRRFGRPQSRIFQLQPFFDSKCPFRIQPDITQRLNHGFSIGIQHFDIQLQSSTLYITIHQSPAYTDFCLLLTHERQIDINTWRGVVGEADVLFPDTDEPYIAINTAKNREIAR